ncbi:hypothetical protein GCM10027162_25720 [Streptomyces incanus]
MHFLGNCLIEPTGPDNALVETYFVSAPLTTKDPHRTIDAGGALTSSRHRTARNCSSKIIAALVMLPGMRCLYVR